MDSPRDTAVAERRHHSQRKPASQAAPKPVLRVVPPPDLDPADLKNPALYINRELSWLEFNQRVLDQALDASHPLLERVKFLAIAATNLDEFFMIRVSTTQKNLREGIEDVAPDGYNTAAAARGDARAARCAMLQDGAACWDAAAAAARAPSTSRCSTRTAGRRRSASTSTPTSRARSVRC